MPLTPAAQLTALEKALSAQQFAIQEPIDYYDGRHRMAFATSKFREAFGGLFGALADNWCQTVVDAPVERLKLEGFRVGTETSADDRAQEIWQKNGLDADSTMAHTEACKTGCAYLLVEPGDNPRITVEHPSQVIVATAGGNRRKRTAALKKWREDDGYDYAVLYLPNEIVWYRSQQKRSDTSSGARINWGPYEGGGTNPLGVVPVLPLFNNPSMLGGGRSDLLSAIPLQDAINKELADMLVASEFAAFPQRVFIGAETPTLPGTQTPDPAWELKTSVQRILMLEDDKARIDQFAAADLSNYVNAITLLLQHLAAQTRTPPHYLLGQIVNASGDALKAAETGLVAKTKRKIIDFSDPWEEAMGLALGQPAADIEGIWADPEYRSEAEAVDAAVKLRTLGVAYEALWERVGYSPQEIQRFKVLTGLPDNPPPGATTSEVPSQNGAAAPTP